jgi:hypothetical protein
MVNVQVKPAGQCLQDWPEWAVDSFAFGSARVYFKKPRIRLPDKTRVVDRGYTLKGKRHHKVVPIQEVRRCDFTP